MLIALAVLGVLCLLGVGSLAVFLVGYGMGWTARANLAVTLALRAPEPEPAEIPDAPELDFAEAVGQYYALRQVLGQSEELVQ